MGGLHGGNTRGGKGKSLFVKRQFADFWPGDGIRNLGSKLGPSNTLRNLTRDWRTRLSAYNRELMNLARLTMN